MVEVSDQEARKIYASRLVSLWLECIDFSHESQKFILRDELENEITLEYLARLTRLWKEFKPKVQNRTELKELVDRYMSFEKYAIEPKLLLSEVDKIYQLEEVLCEIMDKLGLTKLENLK